MACLPTWHGWYLFSPSYSLNIICFTLLLENSYEKFVHLDDMPHKSEKKVVDGEAQALGLKSRYALKCCRNYLYRR